MHIPYNPYGPYGPEKENDDLEDEVETQEFFDTTWNIVTILIAIGVVLIGLYFLRRWWRYSGPVGEARKQIENMELVDISKRLIDRPTGLQDEMAKELNISRSDLLMLIQERVGTQIDVLQKLQEISKAQPDNASARAEVRRLQPYFSDYSQYSRSSQSAYVPSSQAENEAAFAAVKRKKESFTSRSHQR
jgi:hypothetical protein